MKGDFAHKNHKQLKTNYLYFTTNCLINIFLKLMLIIKYFFIHLSKKTINMIKIIKDYLLYDRANNSLVKFDSGDIVLYADKYEAINDKYGNEEVIQFENLPIDKQKEIIKQLICTTTKNI